MPDRLYRIISNPRPIDRFVAHFAEMIVAILGLVVGILVMAGGFLQPVFIPAPSLAELPSWQGWATGIFMFIGSGCWIFASLHRFKDLTTFWQFQRTGLSFAFLGWSGYSLAAIMARPHWVIPWVVGGGISTICGGLLIISFLSEKQKRNMLKEANECPRST